MNKRPYDDRDRGGPQHKKQKPSNGYQDRRPQQSHYHYQPEPYAPSISHDEALATLPPAATTHGPVPSYTPFTSAASLPPLPQIITPHLSSAPFRHKSSDGTYNRSTSAVKEVTYEKLEFLGDAYLELLASRLLYAHFPHLTAGQQSQLRELLVKNETLSTYARAYGFDKRVQVGDMQRMMEDCEGKAGNKGFNKVLGDVFEAYVAAVVLEDQEDGFAVVEKWMTALWAPKLVEAAQKERYLTPNLDLVHTNVDLLSVYNPAAKAELQKLLLYGPGVKLDYLPYQASVELKGDQLGQNRHYIAVYFTGYGYEKKLLGKGEGKNKAEAGNWAAQEAMHGNAKDLVALIKENVDAARERKRKEREANEVKEVKDAKEEKKTIESA